ncbi:MAG: ABC transporter permease subunit [Eubacteriales bacterium]|nr:ABC transporter permease subunit [bacterium]MDY2791725.1 ABC transporter permease subunit [Eubacteriales bacterium]
MSKARRRRLWRRVKRKRVLYLMLLPGMLLLLIFHYIPMWGVLIAFKDYRVLKGILASDWVGLKHFRAFFGGRMFSSVVLNTLILNCYSLIFAFPLPLVFALMLNEVRVDWFKKGVQTITYMPHFISTVVIVGMMKELLSPTNGIVNQILMRMGHEPIYFFGKAGYFRSLYIISGAWAGTGWGSIVYLAAITAVDVSLYEAATIDGASRLQKIWHVTLPCIRSTFMVMLILRLGQMLGSDSEKVLLMQTSGNRSVSELLSTYIYNRGVLNSEYSYSTAVGLFNSAVSFLLILVANTLSRRLTEESLW